MSKLLKDSLEQKAIHLIVQFIAKSLTKAQCFFILPSLVFGIRCYLAL